MHYNFHRRNLPHWDPENAMLFLTIRLHGSIPRYKIEIFRKRKEEKIKELKKLGYSKEEFQSELNKCHEMYFGHIDTLLNRNKKGPHWLKDPGIAKIWMDALHYFDNERYTLVCSTVMSNHGKHSLTPTHKAVLPHESL